MAKKKLKDKNLTQMDETAEQNQPIDSKNVEAPKLSAYQKRKQQEIEYKNSVEYQVFQLAKEQKKYKKWYKLDNAALLYPMTGTEAMFRLSATLNEPVDAIALQKAVNDLFLRFPTMTGTIKYGIFWPYIDRPQAPIVVNQQKELPCAKIPLNGKWGQTRVVYFNNEIACEFFHSATDGSGGLIFLNTLLACYFRHLGRDVFDLTNCLDSRDKPSIEEIKDHFSTIAIKKNPPKLPTQVRSKPMAGTLLPHDSYITRKGYCSATELYNAAKKHNATVTEFLGAAQLWALKKHNEFCGNKSTRPTRILVAVNLRRIYNLDTLRNFTNYIFYSQDKEATFDEILEAVKLQQKSQLNTDYFNAMVSYNYNSGNHPLLKIVPVPVKKLAMGIVVSRMGDGVVNTSTLSNLGVVKAPKEFSDLVVRYDFQLGKLAKKTTGFAVATYNNVCSINITSSIVETVLEREFFGILTEFGVNFAIESDIVEGLE